MRERREELDPSGSTAQFRAFADADHAAVDEASQPWEMRAPGSKVALLAGVVVVVALALAAVAFIVIG